MSNPEIKTKTKTETSTETSEYSIDELARTANMTVRNVRAYQDRGLIAPPEIRGRKGIYSDTHLARLRLVAQLLERGYTINNIGELLEAWEKGQDLSALFQLESAITSPFVTEVADVIPMTQLVTRYGMKLNPKALAKAMNLGIIERKGTRFKIPSPRLLHAGAELVKAGIPLEDMLDLVADLRGNVERVANGMVKLVAENIVDHRFADGDLPPSDAVPELAELIWRLRPLVENAVMPEVSRAMQQALQNELGDRLTVIMEHMQQK